MNSLILQKLFLTIMFASLFFNFTHAQDGEWKPVGEIKPGEYRDLFFINENTGWRLLYAGPESGISKTNNGGESWIRYYNLDSGIITKLFFSDSLTGWAVGSKGKIIHTTDGGVSWIGQTSQTSLTLSDVFFLNNQTGWIVGENGIVLKTTNSGTSWTKVSSVDWSYNSVFFIDEDNGWIAGDQGRIRKTTDGGLTWSIPSSGLNTSLLSVSFATKDIGYIGGAGGILLRTTNGGQSWSQQTSNVSNNIIKIHFTDSLIGVVLSNSGELLKTKDGGNSWNRVIDETTSCYTGFFLNDTTGYMAGYDGSLNKLISSGTNWLISSGYLNYISVISLARDNALLIDDSRNFQKTIDAGITWKDIKKIDNMLPRWMSFSDDLNGWAVGSLDQVGNTGTLLKTQDGGNTWQKIDNDIMFKFNTVYALNSSEVWVAGWAGKVLHTTDGGTNWNSQTSNSQGGDVWNIYFTNEDNGWLVGNNGHLAKTTDKGSNWTTQQVNLSNTHLRKIEFSDMEKGLMFGRDNNTGINVVYKSADSGNTWNSVDFIEGIDILDFSFAGKTQIWALGIDRSRQWEPYSTKLIFSEDAGDTWSVIDSSYYRLYGINMWNSDFGWAVGLEGTVFRYSGNETSSVSKIDKQPNIYSKSYPTPFTSTTTIEFYLKLGGHVSLNVYNLQGKLVATLVNEKLPSGTHRVEFNGSGHASGLYTYVIKTNSHQVSGKMILQ